jgi:hypothetical protein
VSDKIHSFAFKLGSCDRRLAVDYDTAPRGEQQQEIVVALGLRIKGSVGKNRFVSLHEEGF